MSINYWWSQVDGGTIAMQDGPKTEYLLQGQIAERMNKMQAVVDAAENVRQVSSEMAGQSIRSNAESALSDALDALKPKTPEQLLAERLEAADNLRTKVSEHRILTASGSYERLTQAMSNFDAAKAAHEASLK